MDPHEQDLLDVRPSRSLPIWRIAVYLALFGVLIALGIRGFLQADRRPLFMKEPSMRTMATAIESYAAENNAYPPMRPLIEVARHPGLLREMGGAELMTIAGITTPVAYLEGMPPMEPLRFRNTWTDIWPVGMVKYWIIGSEWRERAFWPIPYYNDRDLGWIVWQAGPDGVYDIVDPAAVYDATEPFQSELVDLCYDPTNGLWSAGDLIRMADRRYDAQPADSMAVRPGGKN